MKKTSSTFQKQSSFSLYSAQSKTSLDESCIDKFKKNQKAKQDKSKKLLIHNQQKITYSGRVALFEVLGYLPFDFSNMRVCLCITNPISGKRCRRKLDLFDEIQVEDLCRILTEQEGYNLHLIMADLNDLSGLLEIHREQLYEKESIGIQKQEIQKELSPVAQQKAMSILKSQDLLKNILSLIGQSGIIGEEPTRLLLFIIASSYKTSYPLHALVEGESGSGKSYLINTIAECIPKEDVINLTRITNKSLYNYEKDVFNKKLVIIQDLSGMESDALYAFREMQSAGFLNSSTTIKDRFGITRAKVKQVTAHFSSLTATTNAEILYDNLSRSVIVGIDESTEQTMRIIDYQNQKISGIVDSANEEKAKSLLKNCIRLLRSYEVKNIYADKIKIPVEARTQRRLNFQFQNYIALITILHQYQRKKDDRGRLITTSEDVTMAIETFFPSLFLKVDELDSSTRQFFERLKSFIKSKKSDKNYCFGQREIRQAFFLSKSRIHSLFNNLKKLEYIQVAEGFANKGYKYRICYWDDLKMLIHKIQNELTYQITQIDTVSGH